ncbi:unnamed protein product [Adineta steineri]|uniref:G-protein coupled receptors family 1 profile domain-containing protein n=1 Tax=Adineta steineri TaxID=433720 RepID=A0A819EVD1_9BILA|nr:unnamed protein product [Adineta steineri]CAF0809559.1 unnamed protein product [Adineta steineri]CAF0888812.1 unnamed protein product [Adineta steineri]CAF3488784.1 unnamed protein product [Adineta steineri]CAF3488897.1 unnamed protein product [Adineta steineri]
MADINNTTTTIHNSTIVKSNIIYVCIRLIMPCAVAIGIIGNLLSILVFARREMIKFCVSIFTIVLALSDILLLTTSLFNIILPDFFGGRSMSDKSAFWCHFHGYFDLLFAALSGYSMVFISVERWFSVWKPFEKAKYVTFKTTIITVVSYVSISIVAFSWFPLTLHYNPNAPKGTNICDLTRPTIYKVFGTISVIFTYIVPFISLGILNTLIVYRLQARQNTSIQRSMTTTSSTNVDPTLGSASTRKRQRQRNIDRNITFMLIAVAVAFMVMSFPYQIYWFYLQTREAELNQALYTLTQTFRYLNCCCNFFLYSATSSLFRRELQEIFKCTNSLINKKKETNNLQTGLITRTRTASSPPLYATNLDNKQAERKKLLTTTTTTSTTITTAAVDNVNLALTPTERNNGHVVSFKT